MLTSLVLVYCGEYWDYNPSTWTVETAVVELVEEFGRRIGRRIKSQLSKQRRHYQELGKGGPFPAIRRDGKMRDGLFETDFWRKNPSRDGFLVAVKIRLQNPSPIPSIYTAGL